MKLLVFAHTPPPHHGQSVMVKLMLEGFGGDVRRRGRETPRPAAAGIECYHVNCRYSSDLEDIGSFRPGKFWLLVRYCLEAIWIRFRHGVRTFYYVPAPGKRAAMYRDWLVMLLCRPFFRDFVHHWHAVGLGDWLKTEGTWFERWLTHRLLGRPALGIALAIPSMRDALWFRSRRVTLVPNGIDDPCPDFDRTILPRRLARAAARRRLLAGAALTAQERAAAGGDPEIYRVLFLAHCIREKGLFDLLDGVLAANAQLTARGAPIRIHLTAAGAFLRPEEEAELRARVNDAETARHVTIAGFVAGERKTALLESCDCLGLPTYYDAESFGLAVVEGLASGMNIVATRWRAVPDLLPADYPGLVAPRAPQEIARALVQQLPADDARALRAHFVAHYAIPGFRDALRETLLHDLRR